MEKLLVVFDPKNSVERPLPPDRKQKQRGRQNGRRKKNVNPQTGFDIRTESYKLFVVDLTQIPGLLTMVLLLFGEVGTYGTSKIPS